MSEGEKVTKRAEGDHLSESEEATKSDINDSKVPAPHGAGTTRYTHPGYTTLGTPPWVHPVHHPWVYPPWYTLNGPYPAAASAQGSIGVLDGFLSRGSFRRALRAALLEEAVVCWANGPARGARRALGVSESDEKSSR